MMSKGQILNKNHDKKTVGDLRFANKQKVQVYQDSGDPDLFGLSDDDLPMPAPL